jgi:hypothetical protein
MDEKKQSGQRELIPLPYRHKESGETGKPREPARSASEYEAGADLRRLRTLGDGPVAPSAAAYNARIRNDPVEERSSGVHEDDEQMGVGMGEAGWVEPGLKGWLCVLGVRPICLGQKRADDQAFLCNAICCKAVESSQESVNDRC